MNYLLVKIFKDPNEDYYNLQRRIDTAIADLGIERDSVRAKIRSEDTTGELLLLYRKDLKVYTLKETLTKRKARHKVFKVKEINGGSVDK